MEETWSDAGSERVKLGESSVWLSDWGKYLRTMWSDVRKEKLVMVK